MPMIFPRRSRGKAALRRVRLSGVTIAAPSPWTERAAISRPVLGAKAQAADERVKRERPTTYMSRRPRRSPKAAAGIMPAAKTKRYEFTAHSSVDWSPPRSRWTAGKAVMTTSASSATIKKATEVRERVQAGPVFRRGTVDVGIESSGS
jgi:hypothetical protein